MSGLEIHNLNFNYKKSNIFTLRNLNLNIPEGSIVVLVGHSGCGKSTLLRLIAGFHKPEKGSIKIGNKIVSDLSQNLIPAKRNIGMVFQTPSLFPHKTILENIAFAIHNHPKEMVHDLSNAALDLVGMDKYKNFYPNALSGGQQQLITLARALVNSPSLLMLDEPFSNIDIIKKQKILSNFLEIIKKRKTTTIIVTHDPLEALEYADLICFMDQGQIIQYDTPQYIYHQPKNTLVASFFGRINKIDIKIQNDKIYSDWGMMSVSQYFMTKINKNKKIYIRPEAFIETKNSGKMCLIQHVNYFTNNAIVEYCDNSYWIKLKSQTIKRENDNINLSIDQNQILVL